LAVAARGQQHLIAVGCAGSRDCRTRKKHVTAVILIALTLAAVLGRGQSAKADEAADGSGWSFQVTPYIWGAGLDGKIATRSELPTVDVDVDFEDILDHTDFAFMLLAEARYGRFGFVTDATYLSVSADGDTPGPLFSSVDADSKTFIGTFDVAYRVIERTKGWLDLVAGGRVWFVDADVTFKSGLLPERKTGVSESWVDPVVGLRGRIDLGSRFMATAYGDVGGGASDLTWQAYGALGYRFDERVLGQIGYRYLSVDYDDDGFVWDVDMGGPFIGVSIRF
jgi:hypothetical protein